MTSEPTGVDLARVALQAAREAAKKRGVTAGHRKRNRRPVPAARRDGREPLQAGSAITAMMAARGWETPTAGGDLLARFDEVLAAAAPELAGHVKAVAFDAESGQLDLVPAAPAYGTKVRWTTPKLIAQANEAAAGTQVRTIRVLSPAALTAEQPSTPADTLPLAVSDTPLHTVDVASAGYQRAVAAYQDARPEHLIDPAIHAATERQIRARLREPEKDFRDGQHAQEELRERAAHHRDTRSVEASRAAALRRMATEKAGQAAPRAHLGRTA